MSVDGPLRELAATNEELRREIIERKRAEAELARLYEQVRANRERLELLSRQLLQAHEAERRSIARELHDEIGQQLTGLSLLLTNHEPLSPEQAQAQALVRDLIAQVRNLALDLRPAILDDLGLLPALVWLFERYTTQTNVFVRFEHRLLEEQRFEMDVETSVYRIVQEALTNVARHAGMVIGQLTIHSTLHAGTRVTVVLPLRSSSETSKQEHDA